MGILRTIKCDVQGCWTVETEKIPDIGWTGWGQLQGRVDAETGSTSFSLCPAHLDAVFNFTLTLEG